MIEELYRNNVDKKSKFIYRNTINGIKEGIPIAIGYVPIAIAFGLISKSSGVPAVVSIFMSLSVFAGASQFIAVNLLSMGTGAVEIVMTTLILNFRHFLMSSSLSQRLPENVSKKMLSVLAFGVTDETFAMLSLKKEDKLNSWFVLGLQFIAYISWVLGTWAGIVIGDIIPKSLSSSMGIALYVMFIGLLVPAIRESRQVLIVAVAAMFVNSFLRYISLFSFISTGWAIIISTVIASLIGAILFPQES